LNASREASLFTTNAPLAIFSQKIFRLPQEAGRFSRAVGVASFFFLSSARTGMDPFFLQPRTLSQSFTPQKALFKGRCSGHSRVRPSFLQIATGPFFAPKLADMFFAEEASFHRENEAPPSFSQTF